MTTLSQTISVALPVSRLETLLSLSRQARTALSAPELGFLLVNGTHALSAFRQSALWLADEGVYALSGVVQIEANAPYVHWLGQVCAHLALLHPADTLTFEAGSLPRELGDEWGHWWPVHALWLGWAGQGGLVLVRDEPWSDEELAVLREWGDSWLHAFGARRRPPLSSWQAWRQRLQSWWHAGDGRAWWRRRSWQVTLAVLACLVFPVRLTVLAPGELVPAHPVVVRAPLEGVVDTFHVQPNQRVQKDQPLFGFDEALIQSRLDVAQHALSTAETDYRQTSQLALTDTKSRTQLNLLLGKIEEKRAEVDFLAGQLARSRVLAPSAGVVLMDDPSEWIGRPVAVGERILRIAAPADVEVEAWVPLADAIDLSEGAEVQLYLNASPLAPVHARLRYMAHDAVQRPEGLQAYRVRASLSGTTDHRVGLKGTAKLHGGWVPLVYWMLRRPWAALRGYVGY